MEIYAIPGETKQSICRRAHAPMGAVIMNEKDQHFYTSAIQQDALRVLEYGLLVKKIMGGRYDSFRYQNDKSD